MIKTSTTLFAVIGDPIAHSLSPLMQNWMIHYFKIDAAYVAFHVKTHHLKQCVDGIKAFNMGGINVTVPHKEQILKHVDQKSRAVELLGAANTLKLKDGSIAAYVTDPFGFIESLGNNRSRFENAKVLMFGAGGAAKSVAYALSRLNINKLTITDIIDEKADLLAATAKQAFKIPHTETVHSTDINDCISDSAIIINASAVGMMPDTEKSVLNDYSAVTNRHFVFDLIYNPGQTALMKNARNRGTVVQNGLDMLIFQGLQSLRIWMNEEYELKGAALNELKGIMKQESGFHE
ncbi:shikimate dehydrogenase [candidate division KSB1 bacterium]|nr:shikimate dehydrogenase [candidate division KSB1 bacterium]